MRKIGSALIALAMMLGLGLLFAPSASAHTQSVSLTCANGIKVNLTNYNASKTNTVVVKVDGATVAFDNDFGSSFSYESGPIASAYDAHTAKVVITAGDDPEGTKGWTKTYDLSLDACQEKPKQPEPKVEVVTVDTGEPTCESDTVPTKTTTTTTPYVWNDKDDEWVPGEPTVEVVTGSRPLTDAEEAALKEECSTPTPTPTPTETTPTPTPTPTPTESTPTATPTKSTPPPAAPPELPKTGAPVGLLAGSAGILGLIGAAMLFLGCKPGLHE